MRRLCDGCDLPTTGFLRPTMVNGRLQWLCEDCALDHVAAERRAAEAQQAPTKRSA